MSFDKYLLQLALRSDYCRLKEEILVAYSHSDQQRFIGNIPDIEMAVLAIRKIIDKDDDFERYETVAQLLAIISDQLTGVDRRIDIYLEHVAFYVKMLDAMSRVGRRAAEEVVGLLREYFPAQTESYDKAFAKDISSSFYSQVRKYILVTLLGGKRSEQFATRRFPIDSAQIRVKLRKIFDTLLRRLLFAFEPIQLSLPFEQLRKHDQSDPTICLYYETFNGESQLPSEEELIHFIRRVRNSQLSEKMMPSGLILPTPNFGDSEASSLTPTQRISPHFIRHLSHEPKSPERQAPVKRRASTSDRTQLARKIEQRLSASLDPYLHPSPGNRSPNATFTIGDRIDDDYAGPDLFAQENVDSSDLITSSTRKRRKLRRWKLKRKQRRRIDFERSFLGSSDSEGGADILAARVESLIVNDDQDRVDDSCDMAPEMDSVAVHRHGHVTSNSDPGPGFVPLDTGDKGVINRESGSVEPTEFDKARDYGVGPMAPFHPGDYHDVSVGAVAYLEIVVGGNRGASCAVNGEHYYGIGPMKALDSNSRKRSANDGVLKPDYNLGIEPEASPESSDDDDFEFEPVDLEAEGITKIYDADGNLIQISGEDICCLVQIEPIDFKELRRANVDVNNFGKAGTPKKKTIPMNQW